MTELQLRAFDFIREISASTGTSPTIAAIAAYLGMSWSRANDLVDALVRMGKLTRQRGHSKSLQIAGVADVRLIDDATLMVEAARRGLTFEALKGSSRAARNRGAVTCAADCCQETVRPGQLFCLGHWRSLPHDLQDEILSTFRDRDADAYQAAVTKARDLIDCGRAFA